MRFEELPETIQRDPRYKDRSRVKFVRARETESGTVFSVSGETQVDTWRYGGPRGAERWRRETRDRRRR